MEPGKQKDEANQENVEVKRTPEELLQTYLKACDEAGVPKPSGELCATLFRLEELMAEDDKKLMAISAGAGVAVPFPISLMNAFSHLSVPKAYGADPFAIWDFRLLDDAVFGLPPEWRFVVRVPADVHEYAAIQHTDDYHWILLFGGLELDGTPESYWESFLCDYAERRFRHGMEDCCIVCDLRSFLGRFLKQGDNAEIFGKFKPEDRERLLKLDYLPKVQIEGDSVVVEYTEFVHGNGFYRRTVRLLAEKRYSTPSEYQVKESVLLPKEEPTPSLEISDEVLKELWEKFKPKIEAYFDSKFSRPGR